MRRGSQLSESQKLSDNLIFYLGKENEMTHFPVMEYNTTYFNGHTGTIISC